MKEVLINFEHEGLEGVVAPGTYLMDAAKRLGIDVNDECRKGAEEHQCSMVVSSGRSRLSKPTALEKKVLAAKDLKEGKRLSCQCRIDKAGEVSVMSVEEPKKEEKKDKKSADDFREEFESMPLQEKFASLVELEAIALGETFAYVLNSPYEAAGKVMDSLAGFGFKKDKADHEGKKAAEHAEEKNKSDDDSAETESK